MKAIIILLFLIVGLFSQESVLSVDTTGLVANKIITQPENSKVDGNSRNMGKVDNKYKITGAIMMMLFAAVALGTTASMNPK